MLQETFGRYDSGAVVRHGYTGIEPEDPAAAGFLREGGWHIENAGSTGMPVGRPPSGIRDEDELIAAINAALSDPERRARINAIYEKEGRSALRQLRAALIDGVAPPDRNTQTVADLFGITRRAARNLCSFPYFS